MAFNITATTTFTVTSTSILNLELGENSAIVNAANCGMLGGGGVDGAISHAGGLRLYQEREALPILQTPDNDVVRCYEGSAVITGNKNEIYEGLGCSHVIHAVGPMYFNHTLSDGDSLLATAYRTSLQLADVNSIVNVAFSLISAGVFRGERTLREVLKIGISTVADYFQDTSTSKIRNVMFCGFTDIELSTLEELAEETFTSEKVTETVVNSPVPSKLSIENFSRV